MRQIGLKDKRMREKRVERRGKRVVVRVPKEENWED